MAFGRCMSTGAISLLPTVGNRKLRDPEQQKGEALRNNTFFSDTPTYAMTNGKTPQTWLCCPSLDTLQHLHVCLAVRSPKLNTVFEMWPQQCPVRGDNHFLSPAGHTISDTGRDAVGLLGHLSTLAHIQPAVDQHPQVLFHQASFQPLVPKPIALHGVVVTQVQDPALSVVGSHTVILSPLIQPVQIPLQMLFILKQINTPAQLGVICKLTEGAIDPLVQVIDKDVKQNWP
ncbi:hypothetical protein llap_2599 [Limosa lapponica baueri]|uniref:Uncharacterized protein n=1 Tax=Limosa lapponica baueri TaxID=1758121 RepID=A0A2I0UM40_LIMLA|nr:hypothetical protein llap_2599 [Limosa lapponica baueri]